MSLLLGIDLGTSYFKVGLFGADGALRGLGRVAVPKQTPAPGRSELAVDDFWRILREGLGEALAQAKATTRDIAAVSYSSQANTFVLLDRSDTPLTPLVIWNDHRAAELGGAVAEFGRAERFARTAGFTGLSGEFAPAKWRWYQWHEPATWRRAARVLTISDYFTYALTGEAVGDASTAAFLGVYSLPGRGWWPEALEFFDVAPTLLSRPLPPGAVAGVTVPRARDLLGLPPGVKFAVGGLDHHMAAIGSGLERLADASISTGTVLAALRLVDAVEPSPGCYHGPHCDGRRFYRLAFDPAGATQLDDYQAQQAPQLSVAELAALAGTVAYDAPPAAPGDTNGRHARAVRALMERISLAHRALLRQVQGGAPIRRVIATGGGARSPVWLQINADVLNATIVAPRSQERACLGAAAFAAVAAGLHPTLDAALGAMVHPDKVIEPQAEAVAFYAGRSV
jgi:sugar (pentulose or hexulose) kinase